MTADKKINTRKLKRQLQQRTAEQRARNNAETAVVAAQHGKGRNDPQPSLVTVVKPIGELIPSVNRTRETTPQLLEATIRSLTRFGMLLPILIDKRGQIVAGHALWEAATRLGLEKIECRIVEHLDPLELEAPSLALNRIGEIGKFNLVKLRERMIAIESAGIVLTTTGFTLPEISQIKLKPVPAESEEDDDGDCDGEPEAAGSISILGDLFQLDRHRLLCGDALDKLSYERVLDGRQAHAVFSDAPYNCKIEGFVGGLGQHKHEDFLMFAGKESDEEFLDFLTKYLAHCRAFTSDGAVIFACMDWRQLDQLLLAGRAAELTRLNILVWNKGAGGMGGVYRSAHEFVAMFCNGKSPATNNVELGANGRDRTNVWTYPGANRKGSSAAKALVDHPTPKPVELIIDALLDVTNPGDVVLDPFHGSGATTIAAEQCDRNACSIELDPKYVDRSIRRWERLTGSEAVHIETGLTFTALAEMRRLDKAKPKLPEDGPGTGTGESTSAHTDGGEND